MCDGMTKQRTRKTQNEKQIQMGKTNNSQLFQRKHLQMRQHGEN